MTVLAPPDFRRPEYFHEIAGLRLGEIVEIFTEIHLVEEPRRSRPVRIPPTPNAFAVALVADKKTVENRVFEPERAARPQRFNRFDEHQIRRAGAIARGCRIRDDGKNSGLKMRGGLEPDRSGPRGGITSAGRHRANLIENDVVILGRRDLADAETSGAEEDGEADDDAAEVPFQNYFSHR